MQKFAKAFLCGLGISICAVATSAVAGEKVNAISVSGNYQKSDQEGDSGNANIFFSYERLIDDSLSLGVGLSLNASSNAGSDSTTTGWNFIPKYFFETPGVPGKEAMYLKGLLGIVSFSSSGSYGSSDLSGTTIGVYLGFERAITEAASAFYEVGLRKETFSSSEFNSDRSITEFNFGLKVSF